MTDDVRAFTAGCPIAVAPKDIEKELARLWRQASQGGGDGEAGDGRQQRVVTRACLWNVIVYTTGGAAFEEAKALVDQISPSLPARVLVLSADVAAPEAPIQAWIEANWHSGGGARQIGSDEVTLVATGEAVALLPQMVRALVVPDVPVAAIWHGVLPGHTPLDEELLASAERVIITGDGGEAAVRALAALASGTQPRVARSCDITSRAWLGAAHFRYLVAGLFDPPTPAEEPWAIREITVRVSEANTDAALLLLGWLAARLRWRDGRVVGARRYAWTREGGEVQAAVEVVPAAETTDVLAKIELITDAGPYAVTRAQKSVILETPEIARKQPHHIPDHAELWIAALGARGRDPLFGAALREAAPLVRSHAHF